MFPSDDPLNNVSPKTRQRFENALARRRSKEGRPPAVIPSLVMQHVEVPAQQAWVHWEYSPNEWARFDSIDWRFKRRAFFWLLSGLLPALVLELAFLRLSSFAALLVFLGVELLALFVAWANSMGEEIRRHKVRQNPAQPRRVTISKQGIWEAGTHFSFISLDKVKMTSQPPVLHFRFTVTDTETTGTYWLRVLVPRGHEEEAASLIPRFRTEVIEAQKQAWQRLMNPPEPV